MSIETLRILRGILLRAFVIGVGFGLLYAGATVVGWSYWVTLVSERWHLIDERGFGILVVAGLSLVRFFLVFVLLVPALAVHWTLKREEARLRARSAA
jgi:ABC-type uncharacterized transport system permease subunit